MIDGKIVFEDGWGDHNPLVREETALKFKAVFDAERIRADRIIESKVDPSALLGRHTGNGFDFNAHTAKSRPIKNGVDLLLKSGVTVTSNSTNMSRWELTVLDNGHILVSDGWGDQVGILTY